MFKAFLLLAAISAIAPAALAVCSPGDIAIGDFGISSAGAIGTIWNSECGIIDQRPNEQSDICGDYIDGSTVICNAGTETPNAAQTLPGGEDWGNCVSSTESCGNEDPVFFCCSST